MAYHLSFTCLLVASILVVLLKGRLDMWSFLPPPPIIWIKTRKEVNTRWTPYKWSYNPYKWTYDPTGIGFWAHLVLSREWNEWNEWTSPKRKSFPHRLQKCFLLSWGRGFLQLVSQEKMFFTLPKAAFCRCWVFLSKQFFVTFLGWLSDPFGIKRSLWITWICLFLIFLQLLPVVLLFRWYSNQITKNPSSFCCSVRVFGSQGCFKYKYV